MFKRLLFIIFFILVSGFVAFAQSWEQAITNISTKICIGINTENPVNIACVTFSDITSNSSGLGVALTNKLITSFVSKKNIKMIDRSQFKVMLKEMKLSETGLLSNENGEVEKLKVLKIQILITGVITELKNDYLLHVSAILIDHAQLIAAADEIFEKNQDTIAMESFNFSDNKKYSNDNNFSKKVHSESAVEEDSIGDPRLSIGADVGAGFFDESTFDPQGTANYMVQQIKLSGSFPNAIETHNFEPGGFYLGAYGQLTLGVIEVGGGYRYFFPSTLTITATSNTYSPWREDTYKLTEYCIVPYFFLGLKLNMFTMKTEAGWTSSNIKFDFERNSSSDGL
ncbi:MAG: CsgG/HfaB family protein, partial [Paludibacter sp.]